MSQNSRNTPPILFLDRAFFVFIKQNAKQYKNSLQTSQGQIRVLCRKTPDQPKAKTFLKVCNTSDWGPSALEAQLAGPPALLLSVAQVQCERAPGCFVCLTGGLLKGRSCRQAGLRREPVDDDVHGRCGGGDLHRCFFDMGCIGDVSIGEDSIDEGSGEVRAALNHLHKDGADL